MNKVILKGRLTKDVELKYTQTNNTAVTLFTIAVNRKTKQENQPNTDFINTVAYGKTAEFISQYFKKGQEILIVGRIQTRNYEDRDGKKVYVTEAIVEEVEFVGKKEQNEFTPPTPEDLNSELPFW